MKSTSVMAYQASNRKLQIITRGSRQNIGMHAAVGGFVDRSAEASEGKRGEHTDFFRVFSD